MKIEKYSVKISSVKLNNFEVAFAVEFTKDNMAKLPSEDKIQNLTLNLFLLNEQKTLISNEDIIINTLSKDKFSYIHKFGKPLSNAANVKTVDFIGIGIDADISLWDKGFQMFSNAGMPASYQPEIVPSAIYPHDYTEPILDPYAT